jgi:hypothetical protein
MKAIILICFYGKLIAEQEQKIEAKPQNAMPSLPNHQIKP